MKRFGWIPLFAVALGCGLVSLRWLADPGPGTRFEPSDAPARAPRRAGSEPRFHRLARSHRRRSISGAPTAQPEGAVSREEGLTHYVLGAKLLELGDFYSAAEPSLPGARRSRRLRADLRASRDRVRPAQHECGSARDHAVPRAGGARTALGEPALRPPPAPGRRRDGVPGRGERPLRGELSRGRPVRRRDRSGARHPGAGAPQGRWPTSASFRCGSFPS